tara:strand:+ start:32 stop:745 length:714 start_codon:yes stop_codon:yes gene_type:complete
MAVLGSRDNYNRDPKKMGRFWNNGSSGGVTVPTANTGSYQLSSGFNTTNLWTTVTTASEIVANQSYTIYSVSGQSGFLIHAFTNPTDGDQNTVTYTVTVDGVTSTIPFPECGQNGYMSAWLGQVAGGRMDTNNFEAYYTNQNGQVGGTEFPQGAMYTAGNSLSAPLSLSSKVIDYSAGNTLNKAIMYAQGLDAPMHNPLSCTRFENSLTVAYVTNTAVASSVASTRRNYGALIKLDD